MTVRTGTSVVYPTFRDRYLPGMTRAAIQAISGRERSVVVIAAGSIEQHGPHLPLGTDAIFSERFLADALAHLPARLPVFAGPAITYGRSNEHAGFPGTLTISARTLHRIVSAIARQAHDFGFRTLAVLNAHGGNSAVLVATLREIQTGMGMNAVLLRPSWNHPVSAREAARGFHAGRIETAWMLAVAPHLVHMKRAVTEYPARIDRPGAVRPENAPVRLSWLTHDVSRSGVMGDARAATAKDGRAWWAASTRRLAEELVALAEAVG